MKKEFDEPICEVIRFTWKDVISTSKPGPFTVTIFNGHSLEGDNTVDEEYITK